MGKNVLHLNARWSNIKVHHVGKNVLHLECTWSNIKVHRVGKNVLHSNAHGTSRIAMNIISLIKRF